jgi:hypothetical protein
MDPIVLAEDLPTAKEYSDLRANAGWGAIDEEIARQTISAACYTVTLRQQGKIDWSRARHGRQRALFLPC